MIRAAIPAIAITMTSAVCPNLKDSGAAVPFRPPGWVFAVVWPILYMTTGYAWYLSKDDFLFSLVVGLCCAWLVVYSCNRDKRNAAIIIVAAAIASWYTARRHKLVVPLAVWLTFASYLNIYEVKGYL
jgi:tryptophan-rich sensory protein